MYNPFYYYRLGAIAFCLSYALFSSNLNFFFTSDPSITKLDNMFGIALWLYRCVHNWLNGAPRPQMQEAPAPQAARGPAEGELIEPMPAPEAIEPGPAPALGLAAIIGAEQGQEANPRPAQILDDFPDIPEQIPGGNLDNALGEDEDEMPPLEVDPDLIGLIL